MSAGTGLDTRARLLVIVYDAPLSIAARSREHFGLGLLNKRARSGCISHIINDSGVEHPGLCESGEEGKSGG